MPVDASRFARRFILVQLALLAWSVPSNATTLLRKGLEQLASDNETIVQARVLEIHSYWNVAHSFILTDVTARPSRVLKGSAGDDVVFTLMGGSVAGVTVLVLGGADLVPGSEYMLFLGRSDLPGAPRQLSVPDLSQGAFRIADGRVTSEALEEPLLPDAGGSSEPAGGASGAALEDFVRDVQDFATRRATGGGR